MTSVPELVEVELERACEAARARGAELERAGAVQLVRYAPSVVTAEVDDHAAHVEFAVVDGVLTCFCTCRDGRAGEFCAHCVATALAACRRRVRWSAGRDGARRADPDAGHAQRA
ncbi:hypothetical protein SAMN05421505_104195 [Sinosporangium album]|uniref:SWIM-type domain-containing protein n=1 Tax=Sinosporangium album TaxID=504805 RepID=A0A1G7UCA6_9ACTN|nr:hypothetical protein [Sinosporangium album]SDG45084.1 hypothetical protein SAMN05421505_104195 [Sinosporangium album]